MTRLLALCLLFTTLGWGGAMAAADGGLVSSQFDGIGLTAEGAAGNDSTDPQPDLHPASTDQGFQYGRARAAVPATGATHPPGSRAPVAHLIRAPPA